LPQTISQSESAVVSRSGQVCDSFSDVTHVAGRTAVNSMPRKRKMTM
jgi:hypothetical protein